MAEVESDRTEQSSSATTKKKKVEVNEAVDDPHSVARVYVNKKCRHKDGLTLRFYKDEFLQWEQSAYRPAPTKGNQRVPQQHGENQVRRCEQGRD